MKLELTHSATFALLLTSIVSFPTDTLAQINPQNIPQAIDLYQSNTAINEAEQIPQVHQLRDLAPSDWSYEALRSLLARYGCISRFPDGSFKGNRLISRYEFAAGLNSCLEKVEGLVVYDKFDRIRNFICATTPNCSRSSLKANYLFP